MSAQGFVTHTATDAGGLGVQRTARARANLLGLLSGGLLLAMSAGACGGRTASHHPLSSVDEAFHDCADKGLSSCIRACRGGKAEACLEVSRILPLDETGDFHRGQRIRYARRACEMGSAEGCTALGTALLTESSSRVARDRARALWGRACSVGHGNACVVSFREQAIAEAREREAQPNWAKALRVYEYSCEMLDSELGCVFAADLYRLGLGAEADARRAQALYARACDEGASLGCQSLAKDYSPSMYFGSPWAYSANPDRELLLEAAKGLNGDRVVRLGLCWKGSGVTTNIDVLYNDGNDAIADLSRAAVSSWKARQVVEGRDNDVIACDTVTFNYAFGDNKVAAENSGRRTVANLLRAEPVGGFIVNSTNRGTTP